MLPYLDQFETSEELQSFLDMANACVNAAKEGKGKPIQNPHGFLFAQLRAGYINPPEGYKSRKVRAQEVRNQQLEEELATLRRLKERERELQFELFVARLSEEDIARLDQEAQAQVKPNIGLSPEFQVERYKDGLLKEWFAQRHCRSTRKCQVACLTIRRAYDILLPCVLRSPCPISLHLAFSRLCRTGSARRPLPGSLNRISRSVNLPLSKPV